MTLLHEFGLFRRTGLLGVLACLAVGLAIPTAAGAKVTSLKTCREHILSPGKYRLDANIAVREGTCFRLDASGITLNLNGHTITTTRKNFGPVGILAFGSGAKIVGPGTIAGFEHAITLTNRGHDLVRGVTAVANEFGITINSPGNGVRSNVVVNNVRVGINVYLHGTSPQPGNRIIGNFAHENGEDLRDNNADCLDFPGISNVWRRNDFGTANHSCIH